VWGSAADPEAKEVLIVPDLAKVKAAGLTTDQLAKAVRGRRFLSGKWNVRIDGREFDLAALAALRVRAFQTPQFTVRLRDGRTVRITPDPARIRRYAVTGEYFEQDVRHALNAFSGEDPGKVQVLQMIPVPGAVIPHFTERGSMIHLSVGEPLSTFARVEVQP
jgi:hypothetical protein